MKPLAARDPEKADCADEPRPFPASVGLRVGSGDLERAGGGERHAARARRRSDAPADPARIAR